MCAGCGAVGSLTLKDGSMMKSFGCCPDQEPPDVHSASVTECVEFRDGQTLHLQRNKSGDEDFLWPRKFSDGRADDFVTNGDEITRPRLSLEDRRRRRILEILLELDLCGKTSCSNLLTGGERPIPCLEARRQHNVVKNRSRCLLGRDHRFGCFLCLSGTT